MERRGPFGRGVRGRATVLLYLKAVKKGGKKGAPGGDRSRTGGV